MQKKLLLIYVVVILLAVINWRGINGEVNFSYNCSEPLEQKEFSYETSCFDRYNNPVTSSNEVVVKYLCANQLYDYRGNCEDFGHENIIDEIYEDVCVSSERVGILGLRFDITTSAECDLGEYSWAFNFRTEGIPNATVEQPWVLNIIGVSNATSTPLDTILNFQRGDIGDYLITISKIKISSPNNEVSFTLSCDDTEIIKFNSNLVEDNNGNYLHSIFGTLQTDIYKATLTSTSPLELLTTQCQSGGRIKLHTDDGVFISALVQIEPILTLLRGEIPYSNGIDWGVFSSVFLRKSFNSEMEIQYYDRGVPVTPSSLPNPAIPIVPDTWYQIQIHMVPIDFEFIVEISYRKQGEQLTNLSSSGVIPWSSNFKYELGSVNGFIDEIYFNITNPSYFPPYTIPHPTPTPIPADPFPDAIPIAYSACSDLPLVNKLGGSVSISESTSCVNNLINSSFTGIDGVGGVCNSDPKGCNSNVIQFENLERYPSMTLSYFYQLPNKFDSEKLLEAILVDEPIAIGFVNLASYYLSFKFDPVDPMPPDFELDVYLNDGSDVINIASYNYSSATGNYLPTHGATTGFRNGDYVLILLPSIELDNNTISFSAFESSGGGTSFFKLIPTISFVRFDNINNSIPELAIFGIVQTVYYNFKFKTINPCLVWNSDSNWLEFFISLNNTKLSLHSYCSNDVFYLPQSSSFDDVDISDVDYSISVGPIFGYIDDIFLFNTSVAYSNAIFVSPFVTPSASASTSLSPSTSSSASPSASPSASTSPPSIRSASPSVSASPSATPSTSSPLNPNSPPPQTQFPSPSSSPSPLIFPSPSSSPSPNPPSPNLSLILGPTPISSFEPALPSSSPIRYISPSSMISPFAPPTIGPVPSPSPLSSFPNSAPVNSGNVVGIPGVVQVIYVPNDFTTPRGLIEVTFTEPSLITRADPSLGNTQIISDAVSIVTIGTSVKNTIEICFPSTKDSTKNSCLGYIDESKSPPEWVCEDKCLKSKNNLSCGKTNHLTSFALLFEGIAGNGGCGSSEYQYIFGDSMKDFYLIISFGGFAILIAVIIIILYLFTPLRSVVLGKEGERVSNLRKRQTNQLSMTNSPDASI